jgi:hypothetical protein
VDIGLGGRNAYLSNGKGNYNVLYRNIMDHNRDQRTCDRAEGRAHSTPIVCLTGCDVMCGYRCIHGTSNF